MWGIMQIVDNILPNIILCYHILVVWLLNSAICWINHYPVDKYLDSDIYLSYNLTLVDKCYSTFEQPGHGVLIDKYLNAGVSTHHSSPHLMLCHCDYEDIKSSPLYFVPVCGLQQPVWHHCKYHYALDPRLSSLHWFHATNYW